MTIATLCEEAPVRPPAEVWEDYRRQETCNPIRIQEHRNSTLQYNGKTMKYSTKMKGETPRDGYPLYIALHGGGGHPAEFNDEGWECMKGLYIDSIQQGIYVAPRGIMDTWDMHFRPESYVFFDRLIENMILFENVNSDKVYLLGYSAGGDGVYQIAPRMADRFAAVNMSAGHHNWVGVRNLASVPIALQAGEFDDKYNRNFETAKMNDTLDSLEMENPGQYVHKTWIHAGKGHHFIDNSHDDEPQAVLVDLRHWQTSKTSESSMQNTNAISWLRQFTRNHRPRRVIWDLTTWQDRRGLAFWNAAGHGRQLYWLDIGDKTAETRGEDTIIVRLEEEKNVITIEKFGNYVRLLLDRCMVDLRSPVEVVVEGKVYRVSVKTTGDIQMETLRQRGDPRYIFEGTITVVRDNGDIHVSSLNSMQLA